MGGAGDGCANLESVTKTPVCVLGLGLIGGSMIRAAVTAGREAFGYNRSVEGAEAAQADGFAATTDLTDALTWAAERDALIVLAVPIPAVPLLLGHVKDIANDCPLTDVISVKGAVLAEVRLAGLLDRYVGGHPMAGSARSGWSAGSARLFVGAPWVLSVDEHVDACEHVVVALASTGHLGRKPSRWARVRDPDQVRQANVGQELDRRQTQGGIQRPTLERHDYFRRRARESPRRAR